MGVGNNVVGQVLIFNCIDLHEFKTVDSTNQGQYSETLYSKIPKS